jgi:hypothetical protein
MRVVPMLLVLLLLPFGIAVVAGAVAADDDAAGLLLGLQAGAAGRGAVPVLLHGSSSGPGPGATPAGQRPAGEGKCWDTCVAE